MKKYLHFGVLLLAFFVLGFLYVYFHQTRSVRYVIDDGRGPMYEQVWEKNGATVSFSTSEGKLVGSFNFGNHNNSYFEEHQVAGISTLHLFEKAPEEALNNEPIKGVGEVKDERFLFKVKSERTQAVRDVDGRTVSVTITVSENGVIRSIIKLYDNKKSDYYLPDEMIDKLIIGNEVVSEFHFVAKGRFFIPLEKKNETVL